MTEEMGLTVVAKVWIAAVAILIVLLIHHLHNQQEWRITTSAGARTAG